MNMGSKTHWSLFSPTHHRMKNLIEGGALSVGSSIVNWVSGTVQSRYTGLQRSGVRIHVGNRMKLHVKWPLEDERNIWTGQRVIATIPAEAVRLEAGMFRRSKQRWNRWIGRIVLVETSEMGDVYVVKIHGEDWTVKGYGPIIGARLPGKTWDVVNVVVDPQKINLPIAGKRPWNQQKSLCLD